MTNETTTKTETHFHELCNETHIGTILGMQHPRWLDPHCVECGESIPTPKNWTEEDVATWGTPLSELAR
jgi:hypothetical protein